MSRINTNVSALVAKHNLAKSNADLKTRLERLSTGLQINRGADNPAGLIVSERLRSEVRSVTTAIGNAERAANVIATAEAALAEVSALLIDMRGLIVEAANTGAFSKEEIEANQLQINSAVETITRISNTTSFAGLKLLNGSLDYQLEDLDATNIQDVKVFGANFGTAATIPVTVEVLNSAAKASLFISAAGGSLLSSVSFEVTGAEGSQVFTFASGTALSSIAAAINQASDSLGVTASASVTAVSSLVLQSARFGSDAFVSVKRVTTSAAATRFVPADAIDGTALVRDTGQDVLALINGNLALGAGTKVSLYSPTLNMELNLTEGAATSTGVVHQFTIAGGGARYQIGPQINSQQQVGFGIQSIAAAHLGNAGVGFLNSIVGGGDNSLVAGQARQAATIVEEAITQVSVMRGRLGAFERNTLQTTVRSQQIALENLTASESQIRDTDFAEETARLSRAQVLQQAATSTLAIANTMPQSVLQLLQG